MKKIFLFFILFVFVSNIIVAQEYIKTVPVFRKQTKYDFTTEWQYISTDLYLFNGNRFNVMLNNMFIDKKRKKRKKDEIIENILVTAKIDGLTGYEEIVYPLFYFQVTMDEDGKYSTKASSNEVIRIIDNFPTSSINDFIGAQINIDVISNKNRSLVYMLIASQLQNISNIKDNPTDAGLQLVGEFGKMMEKAGKGQEYHFESTIRLYEEQDFNKQFHSINIFVFTPAKAYSTGFDTTDISTFIATTENPQIDKNVLEKKIDYYLYPYIIAVNYKSKYIPEVPDDINFEILKMRKAKCENNFQKGLINRNIYLQEKKLLGFMEIFAQFKLNVNNYELDYKTKITEDFTIEFFLIIQDLLHLKNYHKIILLENSGDPAFENEFRDIYKSLLVKTDIYLESDNNLRNIKKLVNTLWELENNKSLNLDSLNREEYLRKLYAVKMPERENESEEVKTIELWINKIETIHFNENYKFQVQILSEKEINEATYNEVIELQNNVSNSNCVLCREQVSWFTDDFILGYNEYLRTNAYNILAEKISETKDLLYDLTKEQSCISEKLNEIYQDTVPVHIKLIKEDLNNLIETKEILYEIINMDYYSVNLKIINEVSNKIEILSTKLTTGFNSICTKESELCDCD